ncbi:MAG: hypothetical protein NTX50_05710 [Candidatus Sumerlaeota bacterium]|nr:hypothetical protein [Candidatus Sumerlaeota bacterium]
MKNRVLFLCLRPRRWAWAILLALMFIPMLDIYALREGLTISAPDPAATGNRRSWGPEQATGAPDTLQAGDFSTAWASLQQDAGEEWLELDYNPPLRAIKVRIHETYNPGAVTGVVLKDAQGTTISVIPVTDNTEKAPAFLEVSFPLTQQPVKSVRVLLDTRKVPGWNEIDAVELVAPDARGWAVAARASSTFAEQGRGRIQTVEPVAPATPRDPSKRAWGPEQATGAPDTFQEGDIQTAWASLEQDAGREWLELDYDPTFRADKVRIHETFNPGAVTGIELKDADGALMVTIPVTDTTKKAPAFLEISFPLTDKPVKSVRVLLNTAKVPGWNEIDAVELVSPAGSGWAVKARASSTYADQSQRQNSREVTPEDLRAPRPASAAPPAGF